ncbi:hypothetical protein BGZ61DRAFT_472967 [Ilyonectria robusta]|uniref:uncharacterized protein n=1 Tax=Ilyonectria robusta TaxID=1079257 RepID=UPI001E8E61A4|nr:uncharacterized protein BGZ61DRAFT_472967 [Ilyonectria robusta]KAH8734219.1 hypothetical protein BGZ61DRAFT_472967 [Ilyonectria robusta]
MIEVLLGIAGLIPPLVQFAAVLTRKIKRFLDTEKYIKRRKSLALIRREIKAWTEMLCMIRGSNAPEGSATAKLFRSCKTKIKEYRSVLQQISIRLREYPNSEKQWLIVVEVLDLLKVLKNFSEGGEVQRLLTAVNTYDEMPLPKPRVCVEVLTQTIGSAISSNSNSVIKSVHDQNSVMSGHISDIRAQLNELSEGLSNNQGTMSLQTQQSRLQIEQFDQKLEILADSLLGYDGSSTETDSGDSQASLPEDDREVDTPVTTLHSEVSDESSGCHYGRSRRTSMYCDQSTMTNMVGVDPPLINVPQITCGGDNLTARIAKLYEEIAENQGSLEVVAGSFDQTAPTGFEVMKVDKKDWQQDRNFATCGWGSDNSITLYIALPEGRLKDLVEIYAEDFESVLRTKSTTRRFSAILLPANHIVPPILASRFNFRHILNLHYPQPQLTIHWDMASIATKGQVYVRLGHIKELYKTIETERQGYSGCGLPKIRNIVICITIPWEKYSQWARGKTKHHGLDALWEQGILATLPVMVELADGTKEPHVWCSKKTKPSAEPWSSVKTVHAIFQEYVHPDLPPETTSRKETRFFVVIHQAGVRDEWVKVVQSILSKDQERILEPYRLSDDVTPIDIADLTRHCQQETGIFD